jgi:hypothetical protein
VLGRARNKAPDAGRRAVVDAPKDQPLKDGEQQIWDRAIGFYANGLSTKDAIFNGDMIFYTAGDLVRRELPDHTTYAEANGFWQSGSFAPFKPVLDRAWLPWLEGKSSFESALQNLVSTLE